MAEVLSLNFSSGKHLMHEKLGDNLSPQKSACKEVIGLNDNFYDGALHKEPIPDIGSVFVESRDNLAKTVQPMVRECVVCSKIFATKNELEVHLRTHTGEQPYQCEKCGKCFGHFSNLLMHIRKHNGVRPHKCDICQKTFVQRCDLNKHALRHTRVKQFQCRLCPKAFKHRETLKKHLKIHNSDGINLDAEFAAVDAEFGPRKVRKLHDCTICSESFASATVLEVHMIMHTGENPYKCLPCNKSFISRACYKSHMKTHNHEKIFKCKCCDKSFYHKGSIKIHMRSHTKEKPFKCDSCDKAYSQKDQLKNHVRTHTGERPFVCQVCSQSFTTRTTLRTHTRIHSGEKPFKCNLCNQAFSVQSTLTRHMRIHTGEKPYRCKFCDKPFSDASHVRRHEKRVHLRKQSSPKKSTPGDSCDGSFPNEHALTIHSDIHESERSIEDEINEEPLTENSSNFEKQETGLGSEVFKILLENRRKLFTESLQRCKNGNFRGFLPGKCLSTGKMIHKNTNTIETNENIECVYNERPYGCGLCRKIFETKTDTLRHFHLAHR